MSYLLELALINVAMAGTMAVPAALVGWWGRRPALTHALWLLVLLKLVTPPLVNVPVWMRDLPEPVLLAEQPPAAPDLQPPAHLPPAEPPALPGPIPDVAPAPDDRIVAESEPDAPVVPAPDEPVVQPEETVEIPWHAWVAGAWLAGSVGWLLLAAQRGLGFQRLLQHARPAPPEVQDQADALARTMGMSAVQVAILPGAISPMLWAVGRSPRLLLPERLLDRLGTQQRATVLAHELAHWRRGDHRVRWLEVAVLALYWWCPLAWWACRQLRQAEEECCDAWVIAVLPGAARDYALALVETIDFLSGAPQALPPVASGVGHVRLLQRRLTMILRGSTPRSLTRSGLLTVVGLGALLLPFVPGFAQAPPRPAGQGTDHPDLLAALAQAVELAQRYEQGVAPREQLEAQRGDLEKQRAALEAQLKQLHEALQRLKEATRAVPPTPRTPPPTVGDVPPVPKAPGGSSGGVYSGRPSMVPPGVPAHTPAGKGNIEQRLDQVEKKLDTLLWEITNLRRELRPHSAAAPTGMGPAGGGSTFGYTAPAGKNTGSSSGFGAGGGGKGGPGFPGPGGPGRGPGTGGSSIGGPGPGGPGAGAPPAGGNYPGGPSGMPPGGTTPSGPLPKNLNTVPDPLAAPAADPTTKKN
jgi:beta-lactamase regulating signal transducer with metallopeptidase domain